MLVTTLTKRMAEDLCDYLADADLQVRYTFDIDALERLRFYDLRNGEFDILVNQFAAEGLICQLLSAILMLIRKDSCAREDL